MRKSKYLLRDSDQSGFTYRNIDLVKDHGSLVGPDEFDMPPPSNKSLGGEGVTLNPDARINSTSYAALNERTTQNVTPASGVTFIQLPDSQDKYDVNNQWIYISGASSLTNITSNPQISAGYQNSIITLQGVSNNVILENSTGLVMTRPFNMGSGGIISFIYNATDNLWHELSRSNINGGM